MEVLRWFLFFLLALILIVFAILWIQGKQLPLPRF